jgi:hypothetical protein
MTKTCGCTIETCGCCEGTQPLTPMSEANPPGLSALAYRVGTHGTFLETMKARLATTTVDAPGADGQTPVTYRPLQRLTTRESADPSIAILDSWATVADVLTFYQERIANEGYLRTAIERRSVLELARLVGYTPKPGVSATAYLAYTLDDNQIDPVEIPAGARSQSVPGPDELPQTFETSETLVAQSVWNNLQVRIKRPQNITLDNVLAIDKIFVAGANLNLKAGDHLLLVFGDNGEPSALRKVAETVGAFVEGRTEIRLQPVSPDIVTAWPFLSELVDTLSERVTSGSSAATKRAQGAAERLFADTLMGLYSGPQTWVGSIQSAADGEIDPQPLAAILELANKIGSAPTPGQQSRTATDPSKFVGTLLKPIVPQVSNALRLPRNLALAFEKGADGPPQLLVNFAPRIKNTFYTAWAHAFVNDSTPTLKAVYVMRVVAPLFGASASKQPSYSGDKLNPPSGWTEWPLEGDETSNALFLDQAYDAIAEQSYAIVQRLKYGDIERRVHRVSSVLTAQRTAYAVSSKSTKIQFSPDDDWWDVNSDSLATLRSTLIYGQSEELTLVDEPMTGPVDANTSEVELGGLYKELGSGRWVIFSGERADIEGVSGVRSSELLMIAALRHGYDPNLPGDQTHTTLVLATGTAYSYKRETLTIYGNVVKATHGETRNETPGAGDGSAFQKFTLKQPPLTFVPAATPAGVESTLKVYVNDVEWHETDTLAGLGPKDRNFITKTDDDSKTTVIFGNGIQGVRLPSGTENVKAVYRQGIGAPGNVRAEQISLLLSRPLGVKAVINPLRASGGADKENRDQARDNAPLAVMSLDRLVSVRDYADFTRTFAGIGKADARQLSDGRRDLVHVTIAGADDAPIDPTSDLYRNLLLALRAYGDPDLPIQVDSRELLVLVLSARIRLTPDYQWEPVASAVFAALREAFGFQRRALGQPALLCEVIGVIQNSEGVAWVDVDAFGGIPEKKADVDGGRRLLTLDEMAQAVAAVIGEKGRTRRAKYASAIPSQGVIANVAGFEKGTLRPAQLAIFTAAVPDTIILNQIT